MPDPLRTGADAEDKRYKLNPSGDENHFGWERVIDWLVNQYDQLSSESNAIDGSLRFQE